MVRSLYLQFCFHFIHCSSNFLHFFTASCCPKPLSALRQSRRMGDFSELDIFKRSTNEKKDTRMTRICIKCLKQSNPWVTQDFVCRRFHCETRLVPSDIVERKRYTTFGSSPLNLLPEDGLVTLVDFLSGSDLKNLFFTCSAM